ncbi:MAG: prephenate dehydrogenase/arogenate dehydrogenase family protein [Gemmatimonadota bacterium]|nr:prephenate dehydrogenase/arogenate dehydrogenase family protein [Gemmatimonadota bacterium]MDE2986097.1 prephenate dehydrogenase/arogenate dehydrogenase family protein [Gemmatimonadota bacterium]
MTEPVSTCNAADRVRSVAVVGLGVMGGSVVKALARRAPSVPVSGIEPDDENARGAVRDGVRLVRDLGECDPEGGVVVFAAPLDITVALVRATAAVWSRAALATDVGGLKAPVLEAARVGARGVFVGAHPMCGSERSGYAAARADLFEGADVWLCPGDGAGGGDGAGKAAQECATDRAAAFWKLLGARPRTIAAARHDRLMAWASHLPQLLANGLAAALDEAGIGHGALGPGGSDMTRLAGSSPDVWTPLLEAARAEDVRALRSAEAHIATIRRALEAGDMTAVERIMTRGNRWAAANP